MERRTAPGGPRPWILGDAAARRWTRAVQAALLLYGLAFIWNTSFLVYGRRFFCLFDDAMVSMRYARDCAAGFGLVWNPGRAPVEGYTNFLWTLLMVPWHLLRLPLNIVCLPVQLVSLFCLLLTLEPLRRVAARISGGRGLAVVFALLCSAFYLPLLNWSLQGMETGLLALLFTWACADALDDLDRGRFGPRPYAWLLAATLVRVDVLVLLLAVGLLLAALDPAHRRGRVLAALGLVLGMGLLQAGLRLRYYGAPLPNTYYLKMTGFPTGLRLLHGAKAAWDFALSLSWTLPPTLLGVFALGELAPAFLPLGFFLILCCYSVYVGGDAWEFWGGSNRFISPCMPLFFACAGAVLARGMERWSPSLAARPKAAALGLSLLALACVTPRPAVLLLRAKTLYVPDNRSLTMMGLNARALTLPGASLAAVSAGSIGYFSGRTCVDLLGKSDAHIARLPMHVMLDRPAAERFHPGHLKWDLAWSIGHLRPDVLLQVESDDPAELKAQLRAYVRSAVLPYTYFRRGSPYVRWNLLGRLSPAVSAPAGAL